MKRNKSLFQKVMEYFTIFSAVTTAVLVVLYLVGRNGIVLSCAISAGVTFYHFSMRLLTGHVIATAGSRISPQWRWFDQHRWEATLYRILKVKKWKSHIPTYAPESFDLRRHSPAEILQTMCVSEMVHTAIIVLSFLPVLLHHIFGSLEVFLITSFAGAAVDSIFVILQRYNRPRVARLAEAQKKKTHRAIPPLP